MRTELLQMTAHFHAPLPRLRPTPLLSHIDPVNTRKSQTLHWPTTPVSDCWERSPLFIIKHMARGLLSGTLNVSGVSTSIPGELQHLIQFCVKSSRPFTSQIECVSKMWPFETSVSIRLPSGTLKSELIKFYKIAFG